MWLGASGTLGDDRTEGQSWLEVRGPVVEHLTSVLGALSVIPNAAKTFKNPIEVQSVLWGGSKFYNDGCIMMYMDIY